MPTYLNLFNIIYESGMADQSNYTNLYKQKWHYEARKIPPYTIANFSWESIFSCILKHRLETFANEIN